MKKPLSLIASTPETSISDEPDDLFPSKPTPTPRPRPGTRPIPAPRPRQTSTPKPQSRKRAKSLSVGRKNRRSLKKQRSFGVKNSGASPRRESHRRESPRSN